MPLCYSALQHKIGKQVLEDFYYLCLFCMKHKTKILSKYLHLCIKQYVSHFRKLLKSALKNFLLAGAYIDERYSDPCFHAFNE